MRQFKLTCTLIHINWLDSRNRLATMNSIVAEKEESLSQKRKRDRLMELMKNIKVEAIYIISVLCLAYRSVKESYFRVLVC